MLNVTDLLPIVITCISPIIGALEKPEVVPHLCPVYGVELHTAKVTPENKFPIKTKLKVN
jgi:hypothetical protein